MLLKKNTSRRSALRTLALTGTAAVTGTAINPGHANAFARIQSTTSTALAIIGDESHNSDYIRTALRKTLVEEAGLSVDFSDVTDLISAENLAHYKMLIIFRDGMVLPDGYNFAMYWQPGRGEEILSEPPLPPMRRGESTTWITEAQGKAIKAFVENGGALWAWHNNSHLSLQNKDYRDVEGAVYAGHPRIRPYRVKIQNKTHPIMKDVNDFVVTDEQHYVQYDKDPKYILATSTYEGDGPIYKDSFDRESHTSESVWAYDYGKGRVCFMAPGHMITALWNPEYKKMQKNAIPWLLKKA